MATIAQDALSAWSALLGPSKVLGAEAAQRQYGMDTGGATRAIAAALLIEDSAHLPAVMRIAQQYATPVYPISTGHNWGYGTALPARDDCVIIDLSRLTRILSFDAELGVVTLEPGVTQGMLADFLDAGHHPFLVPVTGAGPSCSILSNALERGYGVTPYVDHFSAVTDLEAVLADGSLYRTALREAGGVELASLFKWGIGPYSAGLFSQSGFGIVTKMSVALAPRPERIQACLFSIKSDDLLERAVLSIRSILSKLPGTVGAINLMNRHRVLSMSAPYPSGHVGPGGTIPAEILASLGKQYQVAPWTGFCTLYGSKRSVKAAQQEIKTALAGVGSRILFFTPERAHQLARFSRKLPGKFGTGIQGLTATLAKSLELVAGRPNETALPLAYWRSGHTPTGQARNPGEDGCGLLWYPPLVPMRSKDVRAYVNMIHEITPRHGLEPLITFTTISSRLFDSTVPLVFDRRDPQACKAAQACLDELLDSGRSRGWFPYRVGVDLMPKLNALQSDARIFHNRLRQALDPRDILSPGRY